MSLMDAMLREGYRDPRDVYIAVRSDGAKGSGTIDDPYDGSAVEQGTKSAIVGGVLNDPTGRTAFVYLTQHGFSDGDLVAIRGATDPEFNGDFVVFDATTDQFKYLMRKAPAGGAGSATTCARWVLRFDAVMGSLAACTAIHLGPGTFQTRGYSPAPPRWQSKPGQKIRGSGMGATTLQLVHARLPDSQGNGTPTHAIGAAYDNFCDHLEVSDLTIDCNVQGQIPAAGKDFAEVSCAAIMVPGKHTRLRRVRAINFGTQTYSVECFVLALAGMHPLMPEPVDCVIEDCVAEQPSVNNVRETTILGMVGLNEEQTDANRLFFHRGCAIRHCVVDCAYRGGGSSLRIKIESIAQVSGLQYKLTTKTPHGRVAGNNVVLNLVTVNNVASNVFNGSFKVDAVDDQDPVHALRFTLPSTPESGSIGMTHAFIGVSFQAIGGGAGTAQVIEGNWVWNTLFGGPYSDTGTTGDLTARDNYHSNVWTGPYLNLNGISSTVLPIALKSLGFDPNDNTFAVAETCLPHGFSSGDSVYIAGAEGSDAALYNGFFESIQVTASDGFRYKMKGHVSSNPQGTPGYFTVDHLRRLDSLTYGLVNGQYVATATTYGDHGLAKRDAVRIRFASKPLFNDYFTVTEVTDARTFKFVLPGNPDSPQQSGSSDSGYWGRVWQVGWFVAQGNIVDVAVSISAYGPPKGIEIISDYTRSSPPYTFRNAVLRDNVVGQVKTDGAVDTLSVALSVFSCDAAIVEGNILALDRSTPVQKQTVGNVRAFFNTTPAGESLPLYDYTSHEETPSEEVKIRDAVEEATLMGLI